MRFHRTIQHSIKLIDSTMSHKSTHCFVFSWQSHFQFRKNSKLVNRIEIWILSKYFNLLRNPMICLKFFYMVPTASRYTLIMFFKLLLVIRKYNIVEGRKNYVGSKTGVKYLGNKRTSFANYFYFYKKYKVVQRSRKLCISEAPKRNFGIRLHYDIK